MWRFDRCLLGLFVLCSAPSVAAVVRVSAAAPGPIHDGTSWETAYRAIDEALLQTGAGSSVWVAGGSYRANVFLPARVGVYGGFAGTESSLDQRDPAANPTVLDGGGGGPVVWTCESGAVLDGFTLTNGRGVLVGSGRYGGGVVCAGGNATLRNITIRGNTADRGGGLFAFSGTITLANATLHGNLGGGVAVVGGRVTLTNSVIAANNSAEPGGGVSCVQGRVTLNNCTIISNTAPEGGGVACVYGTINLTNTILAFNASGAWRQPAAPGSISFLYSDIFGNTAYNVSDIADPTGASGNISADPRLSSLSARPHLQPGSPCINAGTNSVVTAGQYDMDGQPRINEGRVDIGADESDGIYRQNIGRTLYISPDGSDAADGLSWATAKRTLGAGLSAMADNDEVWARSGVYRENILLPAGASLYGGFAGVETLRKDRRPDVHPTVLDGGRNGSTVRAPFSNSLVDGFTIRGGSAIEGGGLNGADVTISSCVFEDNTADWGGAVHLTGGASALTNVTLRGNAAREDGGGVFLLGGRARLLRARLEDNGAGSDGGGVAVFSGDITASQALFSSNHARYGGAMEIRGAASADLRNVTMVGNYGGAVDGHGGALRFANAIVAFNSSGLYSQSPLASMTHSNVFGNTAYAFSGVADPTGLNGNIAADPLFVRRAAGDFRLMEASPCVDTGDNFSVMDPTDLNGLPRIAGNAADMGAYEYQPLVAFTLADAATALRAAAGLDSADLPSRRRLDAHPAGTPDGALDLFDVAIIARKVAGLEANP